MGMTAGTVPAHLMAMNSTAIVAVEPGGGMAHFAYAVINAVTVFIIIGKGMEGWSARICSQALEGNVANAAVGCGNHGVGTGYFHAHHFKVCAADPVGDVTVGVVAVHTGHPERGAGGIIYVDVRFQGGRPRRPMTGKAQNLSSCLIGQGLPRCAVQAVTCGTVRMVGIQRPGTPGPKNNRSNKNEH